MNTALFFAFGYMVAWRFGCWLEKRQNANPVESYHLPCGCWVLGDHSGEMTVLASLNCRNHHQITETEAAQ